MTTNMLYTVTLAGVVDTPNVSFCEARRRAIEMTKHLGLHRVVVRRALPSDDPAVQIAAIEGILNATRGQHNVQSSNGWIKSNAVYSSSML